MMFQGLSQADEAGHVKMEVADEGPSSDLATREACFCLFTKFAKEVMAYCHDTCHQVSM